MYPHWQSSTREISQIWLHGDFYHFFFCPLLLATENLQNHFFFSKSLIFFNVSFRWNFASKITLPLASRELQVKGTDQFKCRRSYMTYLEHQWRSDSWVLPSLERPDSRLQTPVHWVLSTCFSWFEWMFYRTKNRLDALSQKSLNVAAENYDLSLNLDLTIGVYIYDDAALVRHLLS